MSKYIPYSFTYDSYDYDNIEKVIKLLNYDVILKSSHRDDGVYRINRYNVDFFWNKCNDILGAGNKIIIQEYISGTEFILTSFVNGNHIIHTPPVFTTPRYMDSQIVSNNVLVTDNRVIDSLTECKRINEMLSNIYNITGCITCKYIVTPKFNKIISIRDNPTSSSLINIFNIMKSSFDGLVNNLLNNDFNDFNIEWSDNKSLCKMIHHNSDKYLDLSYIEDDLLDKCVLFNSCVKVNNLYHLIPNSNTYDLCCIYNSDNMDNCYHKIDGILNNIIGDIYWNKSIYCPDLDYDNLIRNNKVVTISNGEIGDINNNIIVINNKLEFLIDIFGEDAYILLATDIVNTLVNRAMISRQNILLLSVIIRGNVNSEFRVMLENKCSDNNINRVLFEYHRSDIIYPEISLSVVSNVVSDNIIEIDNNDVVIGFSKIGITHKHYNIIKRLYKTTECDISMLQRLCQCDKLYTDELTAIKDEDILVKKTIYVDERGLIGTISDILPSNLQLQLYNWDMPLEYKFISERTGWSQIKMLNTFNCGYGLVMIINNDNLFKLKEVLLHLNNTTFNLIGKLIKI